MNFVLVCLIQPNETFLSYNTQLFHCYTLIIKAAPLHLPVQFHQQATKDLGFFYNY